MNINLFSSVMNKIINKLSLFASVFALGLASNVSALDLIVQEAGPVGTYPSIASAVAASTDGDRIIINNKPGGSPWIENITINKSLTFLSAVDNARFFVQGNYSIVHAPAREVSIIGMNNVDGSISSTGNGVTSRTIVNIMSCNLQNSGSLSFNHSFFELNASNNTLGSITYQYGKVVGNNLGSFITVNTDALAGVDSVHVVGNVCSYVTSNTTSHYIYISNNYAFSSSSGSISLANCKNGPGINVIRNNSITTYAYGIHIGSPCAGFVKVTNNLIRDGAGTGDVGILNQSTANLTVSFNFMTLSGWDNGSAIAGFTNDGTNVFSNAVAINGDGSSAWAGTLNGGAPGLEDTDLDLTRNDPGCFGGSYSHANFFPIDGPSSKVFYLRMPSQILVGGSNAVTGYSFDR